jgi:hypothetical protein
MFKPLTMAAFVTSMLITTFLTVTSYLGIYLFSALCKEMQQSLSSQSAKLTDVA